MFFEVAFASALVYSPRGQAEESQRSRTLVRDPLKRGDPKFLADVSQYLRDLLLSLEPQILTEFLSEAHVFVPTPRSAPLRTADALWPAKLLSEALIMGKMGRQVLPCLDRAHVVPKAAFSAAGERPSAKSHYDSFHVRRDLFEAPGCVTVIDDVVTKGTTLLAAVARIREAFPAADVRAFALVRTMGLVPEVSQITEPCVGTIQFDGSDGVRVP